MFDIHYCFYDKKDAIDFANKVEINNTIDFIVAIERSVIYDDNEYDEHETWHIDKDVFKIIHGKFSKI